MWSKTKINRKAPTKSSKLETGTLSHPKKDSHSVNQSIVELSKQATLAGMSYGEYVHCLNRKQPDEG